MKIAALITAHNNPHCLMALLKALGSDKIDIYLYIDDKSEVISKEAKYPKNVNVIKNTREIYWGGFSQIQSSVEMLRYASKNKYDYYINLSGVDYIVKSVECLIELLQGNDTEFITCEKMPTPTKQYYRLETYIFQRGNRSRGYRDYPFQLTNTVSRWMYVHGLYRRNFSKGLGNLEPYAGWTWWALTDKCIEYVLKFLDDNPVFMNQFKNSFCADEIFLHTIIMNSPFAALVSQSLTYAIWDAPERGQPAFVTQYDVDTAIKNENVYFLRKFDDKNLKLLRYVDERLGRAAQHA